MPSELARAAANAATGPRSRRTEFPPHLDIWCVMRHNQVMSDDAEVFYRVHDMAVPFDAEHAWSYLYGPRNGEAGRDECVPCNGTGDAIPGCEADDDGDCANCHGDGWLEADRGYSCFADPAEMIEYGEGRMDVRANRVIEFEGEQVGLGCDGEPLAVPSRVVRVITWDEFTAERA